MKKLLILATIAVTVAMHAKMLVPENATSAQQQQAIQIERALQQRNVQTTTTSSAARNVSNVSTAGQDLVADDSEYRYAVMPF